MAPKGQKETEIIVSRDRAKDFLNWELKRSIKSVLSYFDNMELKNNKDETEQRKAFRSVFLDNINGLHKAWIILSPVEWFDLEDEKELEEYKKLKKDLEKRDG